MKKTLILLLIILECIAVFANVGFAAGTSQHNSGRLAYGYWDLGFNVVLKAEDDAGNMIDTYTVPNVFMWDTRFFTSSTHRSQTLYAKFILDGTQMGLEYKYPNGVNYITNYVSNASTNNLNDSLSGLIDHVNDTVVTRDIFTWISEQRGKGATNFRAFLQSIIGYVCRPQDYDLDLSLSNASGHLKHLHQTGTLVDFNRNPVSYSDSHPNYEYFAVPIGNQTGYIGLKSDNESGNTNIYKLMEGTDDGITQSGIADADFLIVMYSQPGYQTFNETMGYNYPSDFKDLDSRWQEIELEIRWPDFYPDTIRKGSGTENGNIPPDYQDYPTNDGTLKYEVYDLTNNQLNSSGMLKKGRAYRIDAKVLLDLNGGNATDAVNYLASDNKSYDYTIEILNGSDIVYSKSESLGFGNFIDLEETVSAIINLSDYTVNGVEPIPNIDTISNLTVRVTVNAKAFEKTRSYFGQDNYPEEQSYGNDTASESFIIKDDGGNIDPENEYMPGPPTLNPNDDSIRENDIYVPADEYIQQIVNTEFIHYGVKESGDYIFESQGGKINYADDTYATITPGEMELKNRYDGSEYVQTPVDLSENIAPSDTDKYAKISEHKETNNNKSAIYLVFKNKNTGKLYKNVHEFVHEHLTNATRATALDAQDKHNDELLTNKNETYYREYVLSTGNVDICDNWLCEGHLLYYECADPFCPNGDGTKECSWKSNTVSSLSSLTEQDATTMTYEEAKAAHGGHEVRAVYANCAFGSTDNHQNCERSRCLGHTVTTEEYVYGSISGLLGGKDRTDGIKVNYDAKDGEQNINFSSEGGIEIPGHPTSAHPGNGSDIPSFDKTKYVIYTPAFETYDPEDSTYDPDDPFDPNDPTPSDNPDDGYDPIEDITTFYQIIPGPDGNPQFDPDGKVPDIGKELYLEDRTRTDDSGITDYHDIVYSNKYYLMEIKTSKYVTRLDLEFSENALGVFPSGSRSDELVGDSGGIDVVHLDTDYMYVAPGGHGVSYTEGKISQEFIGEKGTVEGIWSVDECYNSNETKLWTIVFRVKTYRLCTIPLPNNETQQVDLNIKAYTMNQKQADGTYETEPRNTISCDFKLVQPKTHDFTVEAIKDIDWRNTNLVDLGNTVPDLPISKNQNNQYIAHGYYTQFAFLTREWAASYFEKQMIDSSYYYKGGDGIYRDVEVFFNVPNKNQYNIPISEYRDSNDKSVMSIPIMHSEEGVNIVKFVDGSTKQGIVDKTKPAGNETEVRKKYFYSFFLPSNLSVYFKSDVVYAADGTPTPKASARPLSSGYLYIRFDINGDLKDVVKPDGAIDDYRYTDLEGGWKVGNDEKKITFLYDLAYSAEDDLGTT